MIAEIMSRLVNRRKEIKRFFGGIPIFGNGWENAQGKFEGFKHRFRHKQEIHEAMADGGICHLRFREVDASELIQDLVVTIVVKQI